MTTCAGHTTFMTKGGSQGANFGGLVDSGIGYRVLANEESLWKKQKGSHRKNIELSNPVLKDCQVPKEALHEIITRLYFICLCQRGK